MKKLLLIVFTLLCAININAQTHDFSAVNDGDSIYYRITSSIIPYTASVTFKGSYHFSYDNEYKGSVSIPDSVQYNGHYYKVTAIGHNAFQNCTELTSITIPNSVTLIDDYAFHHCTGLTSMVIPNSVTLINSYAFAVCNELTSITIPNSVSHIDFSAFGGCTGLTSITCLATTPPSLSFDVFILVNKSIPLYVPEASVALYQAADGWRDFYNIQIGLHDITVANKVDILIYPNPTQDKTKIMIEDLNSKADVIVMDIMGKEVNRGVIDKGTKVLDIDLSGYAKGIYNIRIVNENINQTKKLIVQ
ncbi:MAG: leucine-rich repeat domain-containing protein [Bacteroidales bacterium]